jgi:hypothetical protein
MTFHDAGWAHAGEGSQNVSRQPPFTLVQSTIRTYLAHFLSCIDRSALTLIMGRIVWAKVFTCKIKLIQVTLDDLAFLVRRRLAKVKGKIQPVRRI